MNTRAQTASTPVSDELMTGLDEDDLLDIEEDDYEEEEAPAYADPLQNLAIGMSRDRLARIGERCGKGYEHDLSTMSEWKESSDEAMDLATMAQKKTTWPFENSSNLVMPMVAQSVIQFAARAYPAIINDNRPVKARVLGGAKIPQEAMQAPGMPPMSGATPPMPPEPGGVAPEDPASLPMDGAPPPMLSAGGMGAGGPLPSPAGAPSAQADGGNVDEAAKQRRADRQSDFMSWQLLEEMTEWEADTDRLLHILPAIGSCWRKLYFDPGVGRNVSELVHPTKVVVDNSCSTVDRLPRVSFQFELYPWEIESRMRDKRWRRVVLENDHESDDEDAPLTFVEQHCRVDLDGDGYEEPVVVTFQKDTNVVVRVSVDYYDEDVTTDLEGEVTNIERCSQFILYTFVPDPKGGLLGLGFGQLLRSLAKAQNATMNILIDSGILANAGGGFIRKSARIKPGQVDGGLNKWFVTDIPDGVDPFVPFPRPAPDATLFNLLGILSDAGKELTSTTDLMTGDLTRNVQPTTAMALIEQGTKVFNAIYKRIFRALKQEYKALAKLNAYYLNPQTYFEFNDTEAYVGPEDFDTKMIDVAPAADPNMVSDMVEMARVGALQMFMGDPLIDQVKLRQRMLAAMNVDEDMMAPPPGPPQPDPQMQIETAKLELEQQKLQLDQMKLKLDAEVKQRELAIKAAQAGDNGPEGPSSVEQAKAYETAVKAEIEKMMAPLEAAKTRAETALTRAKADAEMAKVAQGDESARQQQQKLAVDAARAAAQERRADQQQETDARLREREMRSQQQGSDD